MSNFCSIVKDKDTTNLFSNSFCSFFKLGILSFSLTENSFKNSLCFPSSVTELFLLYLNFLLLLGLNDGMYLC